MRFHADGPSIPDDLLWARDEGQVLFFCGAGVSRAQAGLPDFYGLADTVIADLGSAEGSPARRLLDAARQERAISGVGEYPADRIFSHLESEFEIVDVRASVAKALRPRKYANRSAHRALLDLARTPDGRARLVTTNFDLLFEACDPKLKSLSPPNLPDTQYSTELEGVVHLHGQVDRGYSGASGKEFILSSADFGRAYLAEGWATTFIRGLLNRYLIVFVGYTADDPPVRYLLEGLSGTGGAGLFAFHAGDNEQAKAAWQHKGVNAIPYESENDHSSLWKTLGAWAERARDPAAWVNRVIGLASNEPQGLSPFERGQVKHLVTTDSCARRFAEAHPPGNWLCVFDPAVRFGIPLSIDEGRDQFDPWAAYSLDDDPPQLPTDPSRPYMHVPPPVGAWDAFVLTRADRNGAAPQCLGQLRGAGSLDPSRLVARLHYLSAWIAGAALEPVALWWAAGQAALHPTLQQMLWQVLNRAPVADTASLERDWRLVFRSFSDANPGFDQEWFPFASGLKRHGWSADAVRILANILRPRVSVTRPIYSGGRPPRAVDLLSSSRLSVSIEYPSPHSAVTVPDEHVALGVREFGRQLALAVELEMAIRGVDVVSLPPLEKDPSVPGDRWQSGHGIVASLGRYVELLVRLEAIDAGAAKRAAADWPNTGAIFARLRIWAAGRPDLCTGKESAEAIIALPDGEFWNRDHQRDLLLGLKLRWPDFPTRLRNKLARRLLKGAPLRERTALGRQFRAYASVTRLEWLADQGCQFEFDVAAEIKRLKAAIPDWSEGTSASAAASNEGVGGWVATITDPSGLIAEPLGTLLARAVELSGHEWGALRNHQPFTGLVEARPTRALAAISLEMRKGVVPAWAWEVFLSVESRRTDNRRMMVFIAKKLSRMPAEKLAELSFPVAQWMLRVAKILASIESEAFDFLWDRFLTVLRGLPESTHPAKRDGRSIDWGIHALNSPVGKLTEALLQCRPASRRHTRKLAIWLDRAQELIDLGSDARCDALVFFSHQAPWFYHNAPEWTEKFILSALAEDTEARRAFLAGLVWSGQVPYRPLYMRLKAELLALPSKIEHISGLDTFVAAVLVAGWVFGIDAEEAYVSNAELRQVILAGDDAFRSHVLWQLKNWPAKSSNGWASRILLFLDEVWPRQRSVKNSVMSGHLVELALQRPDQLLRLAEGVLPFVRSVGQSLCFFQLASESSQSDAKYRGLIEAQPYPILALAYAGLSDNAADWPYGSESVVNQLAALPTIQQDPRMVALRMRLATR